MEMVNALSDFCCKKLRNASVKIKKIPFDFSILETEPPDLVSG
jgi:hypothetical protein